MLMHSLFEQAWDAKQIASALGCSVRHARKLQLTDAIKADRSGLTSISAYCAFINKRTEQRDPPLALFTNETDVLLKAVDAAGQLERSKKTLRRWGQAGVFSRVNVGLGKHPRFRYRQTDIDARKKWLEAQKDIRKARRERRERLREWRREQ